MSFTALPGDWWLLSSTEEAKERLSLLLCFTIREGQAKQMGGCASLVSGVAKATESERQADGPKQLPVSKMSSRCIFSGAPGGSGGRAERSARWGSTAAWPWPAEGPGRKNQQETQPHTAVCLQEKRLTLHPGTDHSVYEREDAKISNISLKSEAKMLLGRNEAQQEVN